MTSLTNDAFMRFTRRAETRDRDKLVQTYVELGSLFSLLSSHDHQVLYGRRGTGKTHVLSYLSSNILRKDDLVVYVDLRTTGSNGGLYGDTTVPLIERASRLLVDVMGAVIDGITEQVINVRDDDLLSNVEGSLDLLLKTLGEIRVVSDDERQIVRYGAVSSALERTLSSIKPRRLWLLLDEWSHSPVQLQPYLAELIRHCFLPLRGVTVKIAAIEQRTRFRITNPDGGYVGFELGADIAADVNLDDFMVFDNDSGAATRFFRDLVFKHFLAVDDIDVLAGPKTSDELIQVGFTQQSVFEELVRAAEGVPRDAINILNIAAQRAIDNPINIGQIRTAASLWYQRDKETAAEGGRAKTLLTRIIDEVIGSRRARAFLLEKDRRHELIDSLFDARLLHILKRNVSARDKPGVRFDVYKLDYGCYVDLIATSRNPLGLLPDDESESGYVDVPSDDYRSIRRAILSDELLAEVSGDA